MSNDFEVHPVGTENKIKELVDLVQKGGKILQEAKQINDQNIATIKTLKFENEALKSKVEQLKGFWKPIIDKFETKFPNAGNANTTALTALTEAFDIYCENEELKKRLKKYEPN